jgi:hypothetical protein
MHQPRFATVTGDPAFAIDLAAVAAVGAGICVASDQLIFMTTLVPVVVGLRFFAWARLPVAERGGIAIRGELLFFTVCLALGAGNDWNTVVRHGVYDYDVPHFFPAVSSIPLWMLPYWGLILRFMTTLCSWSRLGLTAWPSDEVTLGRRLVSSYRIKVAVELFLVVATRQVLYRYHLDPVLSWLPFALALFVYVGLFGLSRHERRLAIIAAVAGPVVEIAFIRLGGLHHYHLGWFGGVPLWIVLWWVLAVLIWNDLSPRLLALCLRSGGFAWHPKGLEVAHSSD